MYENINVDLKYFVSKQCTPDWMIYDEAIEFYDLTFVLKGRAEYCINGVSYLLTEGDAIYIPKGCRRSAVTYPETPMQCVAFNFDYTGCEALPLYGKFTWMPNDALLKYFEQINTEWLQKKPEHLLKVKALFMLILYNILSLHNSPVLNLQVERIKKYILLRLTEKITVANIAASLLLSCVYCGAIFKKHTGVTINQYINNIRINKATSLLQTGEFSISEAAYQSGFDDIYYFSKVFKNIMGMPPSEYKRQKLS